MIQSVVIIVYRRGESIAMRYSLINVAEQQGNIVSGVWIQDFTGTLKEAKQFAKETEAVNGYRIKVAVVRCMNFSYPNYAYLTGLKKL